MKKKKKLVESLLLFSITIILLVSSTVAWFTLDKDSQVNEVILPVGKQDIEYSLHISRNEGEFFPITTIEQMGDFLENAVPGDTFDFRLHLKNTSTSSIITTVMLGPIENENLNTGFDLRDVFVIDQGIVNFQGNQNKLPVSPEDPVTKHSQELSVYRLSHLMASGSSLKLLHEASMGIGESDVLSFRLMYDQGTSRLEYQEGNLKLNRFSIYFNN